MKVDIDTMVRAEFSLSTRRAEFSHPEGVFVDLNFIAGRRQVLPGVERALWGRGPGETVEFEVGPEQGYGAYNENLVQFVAREYLDPEADYQVGRRFKHDAGHTMVSFTVKEIRREGMVVDFNHPLAGEELRFTVKIKDVRPAMADELNPADGSGHGHCHDEQ